MRLRIHIPASALLLIACPALARQHMATHARTALQTQNAIQARYDRINATVLRKDVKGLVAFYSPDYEFVSERGEKITLKDLVKGLTPVLAHATGLHGKTSVRSVKLAAGRAIVRITDTSGFSAPLPGEPPRTAAYESVSTSEDVWVKGPGGWLLKHTHQLTEHRTINGVAVDERQSAQPPAAGKR